MILRADSRIITQENCTSCDKSHDIVEVKIVSRSIGSRRGEPLSKDQHAALIFNLGNGKVNDHWLVLGGPTADRSAVIGNNMHVGPQGWYATFSTDKLYWARNKQDPDADAMRTVPVLIIKTIYIPRITQADLDQAVSNVLSKLRGKRYEYPGSPNSNTFARMVLEDLGISSTLPVDHPHLEGW